MRRIAFWLVLLFAFSIPLEDSLKFGVGGFARLVGLIAVGAWLLVVLLDGKIRRTTRVHWWATAFVGWAYLSYFWTTGQNATLNKAGTLFQLLGVLWMVWDQVGSHERVVSLVRAFVAGCAGAALLTIAASRSALGHQFRFAATGTDPNNTGTKIVIGMALAWYLLQVDPKRLRWVYGLFLALAATAVLLTASRTAAVTLAVAASIQILDIRNFTLRRFVPIVAVAGLAAWLAFSLVPPEAVDRLGTTGTEITSGTLNQRTISWRVSLQVFGDHPLQGVGAAAFQEENRHRQESGSRAHNTFLSTLAELGAVGIVLLLGAIVSTALRLARRLRHERREVRRAWLAVGVAWLLAANTLTWEARKITWFLLALALVKASEQPEITDGRVPSPLDQQERSMPMGSAVGRRAPNT